ncbi:MAG: DUF3034 family protein [Alcanivoracaceae bacterium]|nr:DUF3034 family protein [Alcanivoracaceae bacterium]
MPLLIRTIYAATMLVGSSTVSAEWQTGEGRLLATAGVTSVDGTAGGGIVPMAVLAGYASDGQHGGSVSASRLDTQDFALRGFSAAWSWHNRIELSVARQELNVSTFAALDGEQLRTNSYGAKLRLSGDILYTRMPQISAGVLYRDTLNPRLAVLANNTVPDALGAKDRHGVDVYLAATKVFLGGPFGRNWVLNGVLRHSKANQGGLVGFGGDRDNDYSLLGEASVAAFLNRHWLLGAEYRQHPDNLSAFSQDHWADIFLAWFPNKRWSVTAAWVSLGQLSTPVIPYDNDDRNQSGAYFSLTGAF